MPFDPSAARPAGSFSDTPNAQAAWVCYINGLEVPILGFETESTIWQVPTFRIHLLPDILLERLGHEDRVPVQLFYLDSWYDPTAPAFRLLADGEIIGWSYSNAGGYRTMAFSCAANIHIFQQLFFHFMTNVDDIVASHSPDMVASTLGSQPGLMYPYALFHQGLTATPAQIDSVRVNAEGTRAAQDSVDDTAAPAPGTEPIQAPYEFVNNIIRGCISAQVPTERRAITMMNFFARQIRKARIHNRIVRLPLLEDPSRLTARTGVFPIFNAARNLEALNAMQRHVAGQVGNAGPVWNLVQQTLSMVYMELAMIPNPCSVLVQLNDTSGSPVPVDGRIIGSPAHDTPLVDQRSTEDLTQSISIAPSSREATGHELGISPTTPIRLAQVFVKPTMAFAEPPHCNIFFPSMLDRNGWTYDENGIAQPTRIYVNDSVMTQLLRADGPNAEFLQHALTVGYPEEANALLHHKVGASTGAQAAGPTESGKNLLTWPEEFFKGPVVARMALPPWFQFLRQFSNSQAGPLPQPGTPPPATPVATPVVSTPTVASPLTSVGPAPEVAAPARPDRRGGRQTPVLASTRPEAQPDFPYRWLPSEAVLTRANTQNTTYEVTFFRDMGGRSEVSPQRGTLAFREFLYQRFPNVFSKHLIRDSHGEATINHTIGLQRPRDRVPATVNPNSHADDHLAGRAADLTIPKIHTNGVRRANLEVGVPIANWLIENAEALGIAYIVYARSIWSGQSFGGRNAPKFKHYTSAPNDPNMDHFDHIHVTLTKEAAAGVTGVLARGSAAQLGVTAPITVVSRPIRRIAPRGATELAGSQTGVPETTTVGSAATTTATAGAVEEGDQFSTLFELYAQQEYLRQRYAQRAGGVNLIFNPYPVVGFPSMVFEPMSARMHVVGLLQSISHQGSANGKSASWSSRGQLTYARTFAEFIADVREDAFRFAGRVTSAPAELISEIREVVQDEAQAEIFYSKLLHGDRPTPLGAVFRWTEAMGYADGARSAEVQITGDSVAIVEARLRASEQAARATSADATTPGSEQGQPTPATTEQSAAVSGLSSQGQTTLTTNLDPNREFAPRENQYSDAFAKADVALHLCARPCCTIDEYVRFWHAGKPIGTLQQIGQVGNVRTDFAYHTRTVTDTVTESSSNVSTQANPQGQARVQVGQTTQYTAGFYDRIFKLRVGPGVGEDHLTPPSAEERGYTDPPNITPTAVTRGLPSNYPETRADWDSVLDAYREKVRQTVRPST